MLGLGDGWILAAMIGCVAATVVGVIYGAVNWNRGGNGEGGDGLAAVAAFKESFYALA